MENKDTKKRISPNTQITLTGLIVIIVIMCKPLMVDYLLTENLPVMHIWGLNPVASWQICATLINIASCMCTFLFVSKFGYWGIPNITLVGLISLFYIRFIKMYEQGDLRFVIIYTCVPFALFIIISIAEMLTKKKIADVELIRIDKKIPMWIQIVVLVIIIIVAVYQTDWILLNTQSMIKL